MQIYCIFLSKLTCHLAPNTPTDTPAEFISSAWKLDVGHPPGAPFFMLMGHFFSLFASDVSHVAMCVNALSNSSFLFTTDIVSLLCLLVVIVADI